MCQEPPRGFSSVNKICLTTGGNIWLITGLRRRNPSAHEQSGFSQPGQSWSAVANELSCIVVTDVVGLFEVLRTMIWKV